MSIKNLVEMIKHNGLLASMAQLEKLYQVAIENEKKLAKLEAHRAALAAENAGLKSAIEKHADSYIMCGYCRTERDGKSDDVCEVLDSIPATDAFLAEVRAQESKRVYESILDNPAVTDMESLVDWLEQYASDSVAFAAQLRKGVQS
ncbi:hypothetical protein [Enterobacter hormaechei]|uniref:hypothetical protein n=1 Tax=Enterobacter hormaechei TaxID=158836 RepID=UPI002236AFC0|nr:hypothetical protein [Enterobacter hormaechei]MCW4737522.1 hypothetical protein [Enterobacter hormaechei subsp. xiangfangensis]